MTATVTQFGAVLPGDVCVLAAGVKGNRVVPSPIVYCDFTEFSVMVKNESSNIAQFSCVIIILLTHDPPHIPSLLSTVVPPLPTPCGSTSGSAALPQQDTVMTASGKEQHSLLN